jgi:hypothetical protein
MKTAGIVIMVIGLAMAIYTGFNYVTHEKVVDIGKLEIMADQKHHVDWSPIAGAAIIIVGGGIYLFGSRKSIASHI